VLHAFSNSTNGEGPGNSQLVSSGNFYGPADAGSGKPRGNASEVSPLARKDKVLLIGIGAKCGQAGYPVRDENGCIWLGL